MNGGKFFCRLFKLYRSLINHCSKTCESQLTNLFLKYWERGMAQARLKFNVARCAYFYIPVVKHT